MPLTQITQGQPAEDFTNSIAKCIHLNSDLMLRIKVV